MDYNFCHYKLTAEVEFAAKQYRDALESYQLALTLKPDDATLSKAVETTAMLLMREKKMDKEVPWVGAGLGIIIGVFLLVTEYITSQSLTVCILLL